MIKMKDEQFETVNKRLSWKTVMVILVSLIIFILWIWIASKSQTVTETSQLNNELKQQNQALKQKAQLQLEIESLNVLINDNSKKIEWLTKEIQQAKELKVIKWNKFLEMNKLILE